MLNTPLTRDDLVKFFGLDPVKNGDYRPLRRVLSALNIRLIGGTTQWPVIWSALGLSASQKPCHVSDLTAPLLTAKSVAFLLGVDPSIVYRWSKGELPTDLNPFPTVIDLSGGRKGARVKRWRRAEVMAWHSCQPLPDYARKPAAFGSLTPQK